MAELDQHLKCQHCKTGKEGSQAGHPIVLQHSTHGSEAFGVFTNMIPCGSTITEVFDFYFKILWVFMLAYPCYIGTFMKFMEHKIYNLRDGVGKVQPSINDAARRLNL
jgi:hypothetical protein